MVLHSISNCGHGKNFKPILKYWNPNSVNGGKRSSKGSTVDTESNKMVGMVILIDREISCRFFGQIAYNAKELNVFAAEEMQ